jgi:hyperosmotically inducible periplasmic protein
MECSVIHRAKGIELHQLVGRDVSMQLKHAVSAAALSCLLCLGAGPVFGQQDEPPAADNTKVNKRDRSNAEPTADQGKNNVSDREIMQRIRKSVVADDSLSTYGHNVKIIAQNGKVTLKGPVRSEEEKRAIEQKAADVAGPGNVTNELTIKAARPKKTS